MKSNKEGHLERVGSRNDARAGTPEIDESVGDL